MDLSQHNNYYNQKNFYNYPRNNIRARKSRRSSPNKKKSLINNNDILQFSFNAINNILISNLNSSVSLGFFNLINNDNIPNELNNNIYINSLYDTIDYKIRGNIYKQNTNTFINKFPNLIPLLRNKSSQNKIRPEIKIMRLDKDIINIKNKTPTKKLDKHYYLNLVKSNNNDNKNKFKHFKHNSENIDNNIDMEYEEKTDIKKSKVINKFDQYTIYSTCTTINPKDNNRQNNQNKTINSNKNAYIKKISPKKYIINKTSLNSKEKNSYHTTKIEEPKNQISFKNKFIYKEIKKKTNTNTNSPNKLIKVNKDKENILKNKIKDISNKKTNLIIVNKLPKQIKHEHSQSYNIHSYKPTSNKEINTYYNSNNIDIKNNNNKNVIFHRNSNINLNMNKANKTKFLTLTNINNKNNINKTYINDVKSQNKDLNIPYISPYNKLNNIEISSKAKNKNKYVLCNKLINDSNNGQKMKNVFYQKNQYKTIKTSNLNNNINNKVNNNNVFVDDERSIFKVLDNTQIMTTDEFSNSKNSLANSNKLNILNGSNTTNTNQDTDYNSIKKFNNNNYLTNEDYGNNNYYNNSGNDINFSFNNL